MFETAKPNCMATAMVVALAAPLSLFAAEPSADNWRPNTYHPLFTAAERTRPHVQTRSFSLADWPFLDGQWEGILCDSDGDVWFSIASHSPHHHAQLFRYDRRQDRIEHVADVGEACGETDSGNPPQDKIHTQMWEDGDAIYCGTCEGHATDTSGYRGGYWLKIDKGTRELEAMAKSISGEGLYVMAYDNRRKILYAHTNLNGKLLSFDPATGKERLLGIPWRGTKARWPRSLNLMVAPDGRVYGSKPGTVIWLYDPATGRIRDLDLKNPRPPDPDSEPSAAERYSESQGLRMTVWDGVEQCFYAIRGADEMLMRFVPPHGDKQGRLEAVQKMGLKDHRYGNRYAPCTLVLLGRTLYFTPYTGWGGIAHLQSYDLAAKQFTDHGPIVVEGNRRVAECQSLAAGKDGRLYLVAFVYSVKGVDPVRPYAMRDVYPFHPRFAIIDPRKDCRR